MATPEEILQQHVGLERAIEHGIKAGIRMERRRIAAILQSPEARGREGSALLLALHESEIPAVCAIEILAAAPPIDAPAPNVVDVRARRAAMTVIESRTQHV